jgi:hypothetical protein
LAILAAADPFAKSAAITAELPAETYQRFGNPANFAIEFATLNMEFSRRQSL